QNHRRSNFQLPDPAFHGGWTISDTDARGLRRRALSGPPPAQARNTAEMNESIITFEKVVKRFGEITVLDELDFQVRKGEKVTIIGPSGAGKSTVLRILMTLENINEGVIYVAGKPLWHEERNGDLVPASEEHLRAMRKEMGMVFQQ